MSKVSGFAFQRPTDIRLTFVDVILILPCRRLRPTTRYRCSSGWMGGHRQVGYILPLCLDTRADWLLQPAALHPLASSRCRRPSVHLVHHERRPLSRRTPIVAIVFDPITCALDCSKDDASTCGLRHRPFSIDWRARAAQFRVYLVSILRCVVAKVLSAPLAALLACSSPRTCSGSSNCR